MNRRHFLATGLASLVVLPRLVRDARAIGPQQKVALLRVQYDGHWDVNNGALDVLSEETRLRTSTDLSTLGVTVTAGSERMHDSLFAVLAGDGPFAFDAATRQRLERWMGLGGFLVFDNTGRTAPDAGFDQSVRTELGKIFPDAPLERISPEHVLYRTFYRLDYPAGRAIYKPYVEAIHQGSRLCAVLIHNDLTGALARDSIGNWAHQPVPGGENQREMAIRFGVNLVMYSACLHYKDDQVHIDYLLHKRKWRISPPR